MSETPGYDPGEFARVARQSALGIELPPPSTAAAKIERFLEETGALKREVESQAPPTGSKYSARYSGQSWLGSAMGGAPPAQWPAWTQEPGQNYSDKSLWVQDGGS